MNIKQFLKEFVIYFCLTFVVSIIVSYLYSLIAHGIGSVDLGYSIFIAIIISLAILTFNAIRMSKKNK